MSLPRWDNGRGAAQLDVNAITNDYGGEKENVIDKQLDLVAVSGLRLRPTVGGMCGSLALARGSYHSARWGADAAADGAVAPLSSPNNRTGVSWVWLYLFLYLSAHSYNGTFCFRAFIALRWRDVIASNFGFIISPLALLFLRLYPTMLIPGSYESEPVLQRYISEICLWYGVDGTVTAFIWWQPLLARVSRVQLS